MNAYDEALKDEDAPHLAKHAMEYHGLTLKQFVLMCEEAHKRYEGQFSSSVDKELAVECFYEGFKVACKAALQEDALDRMAENARELGLEYEGEQEPVAWMDKDTGGITSKKEVADKFGIDIPLYTHPAKPLSDDAVNAILVKHGLDNVEMAGNHIDVVLLMRDVERAHGIGKND